MVALGSVGARLTSVSSRDVTSSLKIGIPLHDISLQKISVLLELCHKEMKRGSILLIHHDTINKVADFILEPCVFEGKGRLVVLLNY